MQRRVSCSDARKPSSLCTLYEVSPCICCIVKLAASVRFISDFDGSDRYCGLFLTVSADCSFFSHFTAENISFVLFDDQLGAQLFFVYVFEGKRPLGRPRRRWEDNIKMDLQEDGGGRGDWMELA